MNCSNPGVKILLHLVNNIIHTQLNSWIVNGIKIVMIAAIEANSLNIQEASRTLGCFFRLFIKILTFSLERCKKLVTFSCDPSFIMQCSME
ncbi:hypothetical protein gpAD87_04465 [Paenibacillus sp. AD87]|nr:hypothetical protein gpAD87_04465 [Paenibacillus sp. AD87]